MPDAVFAHERLARIYDPLDPDRSDLDAYAATASEFEARDPAKQAWPGWTRELTRTRTDLPGAGVVEKWHELTGVSGQVVSFRTVFEFEADGAVIISESTLRFRERDDLEYSLSAAGFRLDEVRDAPHRPGLEFVVVASRPAR